MMHLSAPSGTSFAGLKTVDSLDSQQRLPRLFLYPVSGLVLNHASALAERLTVLLI
jgi:hypothetical protein